MPTEPAQLALALFEIGLLLAGTGLILWLLGNREAQRRWFGTNLLPPNRASAGEFLLLAVLLLLTSLASQSAAHLAFRSLLAEAPDREGWQVVVYSVANYLGALLAWQVLFPSLRHSWLVGESLSPTPPEPASAPGWRLPWRKALSHAAVALVAMLPLLGLINFGWTQLVEKLGLPSAPQDIVGIFAHAKSPLVVVGMLLVACVLAPIYEELIFRAGLYRFCRQRLGRGWALVISGVAFGAMHGYWISFVPLAVLGMGLALAYEATGSIRVPILVHALFNLNTVLILLSGLPQVGP